MRIFIEPLKKKLKQAPKGGGCTQMTQRSINEHFFSFHNTIYILLFLLISCLPNKSSEEKKDFRYLTTTTLINDLIYELTQDKNLSQSLMGIGVDPHLYTAQSRDLQLMRKAKTIFYHGHHLEGKLSDILAHSKLRTKSIAIQESIPAKDLMSYQGVIDPHLWFHPLLWIQCAEKLLQKLIEDQPQKKTFYTKNFKNWEKKVIELSNKYKTKLHEIPKERRVLITSHDAFQYLGKFFDLKVVAVQGISTDSQSSLHKISEIIDLINKNKIKSIFIESSVNSDAIKHISEHTSSTIGAELYSDSLGSPEKNTETYLKTLEHNLKSIVGNL